ncbi:UNC-like C-terminal-domain-containing protein [Pelagophyceae sp. CCMP2097]|nr:UNC-like C-terminal-domain-containing protein [Pelagophyceae sp. CCMP2097]
MSSSPVRGAASDPPAAAPSAQAKARLLWGSPHRPAVVTYAVVFLVALLFGCREQAWQRRAASGFSLSQVELQRAEHLFKRELEQLGAGVTRKSLAAHAVASAIKEELAKMDVVAAELTAAQQHAATNGGGASPALLKAVRACDAARQTAQAAVDAANDDVDDLRFQVKRYEAEANDFSNKLLALEARLEAQKAQGSTQALDIAAAATAAKDEALIQTQKLVEAQVEKARQTFAEAISAKIAERRNAPLMSATCSEASCSEADISALVDAALATFSADRVGQFDFALRATGASVETKLTSKAWTPSDSYLPTSVWHALGRDAGIGRAEDALSQRNAFGSCFAFAGDAGALTVRLAQRVVPRSVTVEHLHPLLCDPNVNTRCQSAPRQFRILGRPKSAEDEPVVLGGGEYDSSDAAASTVQTFELLFVDGRVFSLVTLEVLSNHGHADYTCVYRFRVHGDAV